MPIGQTNPIRLNQYEEVLYVDKEAAISVAGPLGTVYVAHAKDSKARVAFMIIAKEEMTVRRTAKEAVDVAIHFAGLSVGSQIEVAGRSVVSAGLGTVGRGSIVVGTGLNALAGSLVKIGAMLTK